MSADRGKSASHLRAASRYITPGVRATTAPFSILLENSSFHTVRVPTDVIVVDLGWDSDEGWDSCLLGIARERAALDDVVGVVLTLTRPDHVGLPRASSHREQLGPPDEFREDDRVATAIQYLRSY